MIDMINTTDKTLARFDSQIPALRSNFVERLKGIETSDDARIHEYILWGRKIPQYRQYLDAFAASCQDVLGAPANQTEEERRALLGVFFLDKTLKKRNGELVELGELRAYMTGYAKLATETLEPLDLAIEAQTTWKLAECEEPDCSVHPELIKIAREVLGE